MTAPPQMMCATCKRLLAWYQPPGQARADWAHPRWAVPETHRPLPVPPDHTAITVCDFCSLNPPVWIYHTAAPTSSITRVVEPKGETERHRFAREWETIVQPGQIAASFENNYDEGWAACASCAPYVERRDMNRLITHVKAIHAPRHRAAGLVTMSRKGYARQWEQFFANVQPGRTPADQPKEETSNDDDQ